MIESTTEAIASDDANRASAGPSPVGTTAPPPGSREAPCAESTTTTAADGTGLPVAGQASAAVRRALHGAQRDMKEALVALEKRLAAEAAIAYSRGFRSGTLQAEHERRALLPSSMDDRPSQSQQSQVGSAPGRPPP